MEKLLDFLEKEGITSNNPLDSDDTIYKISKKTCEKAKQLVNYFKSINFPLPKVSPDEEGELVMIWRGKEESNILIIDANLLHYSIFVDDTYENKDTIIFDETIPEEINYFLEKTKQLINNS